MKLLTSIGSFVGCLCVITAFSVDATEGPSPPVVTHSEPQPAVILLPRAASVWRGEVGEGFCAAAQAMSLSAGASYGLLILGSKEQHDLALCGISYGHMLGG